MITRNIIPAYDSLQAPYIKVETEVRVPGTKNGIPNIKKCDRYVIAPSGKKIATYIVNQIFGSELVTQTEGLSINWLMPTLKESLELGIYEEESFIYIHKFDNKIYLECYGKHEVHNIVQKFDKVISCDIKQEYKGIFKDDETTYILNRHIEIENGNSYITMTPYAKNKRGELSEIDISVFNMRTESDFLPKYILPYECIINIDLGQKFFKDSEKLLNSEMEVINTLIEEVDKTKTKIVTSQHYQTSDIVTNWQPNSTHYKVDTLTVGKMQDYFTLLPGDKEHQIFEFLQGDLRHDAYIDTFKFYDYQVIQLAGLSPASFGYEKDAYMNTTNIDLSKNASDMTIEAIKNQIEPQINNLIVNIIKAQQSQGITENLLPLELNWNYGNNEKLDDMKKLQVMRSIQGVGAIPYSYKAKIITPILNKLIDDDYAEENESVRSLIEEYEKEIKNINIEFGEI